MGVERAVTRWHALRQTIQNDLTALQARLEQLQFEDSTSRESVEAEKQLAAAQARLLDLGPCPKAMMG